MDAFLTTNDDTFYGRGFLKGGKKEVFVNKGDYETR